MDSSQKKIKTLKIPPKIITQKKGLKNYNKTRQNLHKKNSKPQQNHKKNPKNNKNWYYYVMF